MTDQLTERFKSLSGRFERTTLEYVYPVAMASAPMIALVCASIKLVTDPAYARTNSVWGWVGLAALCVAFSWIFVSRAFRSYEFVDGVLIYRKLGDLVWKRPIATIESVFIEPSVRFHYVQVHWPDWSERLCVPNSMVEALAARGSDT